MARASALHAEGQGFDSLILHEKSTKVPEKQSTKVRRIRRTKQASNKRSNKLLKEKIVEKIKSGVKFGT